MSSNAIQQYKPAKTIQQQLDYLKERKRVQYNDMDINSASNILMKYNYINVSVK